MAKVGLSLYSILAFFFFFKLCFCSTRQQLQPIGLLLELPGMAALMVLEAMVILHKEREKERERLFCISVC